MRLRTKIIIMLVCGLMAVGTANMNTAKEVIQKTANLNRISRIMRNDGADIEIIEELGCTIHGCDYVSGILFRQHNTNQEIYLYRITNQNEMNDTIETYDAYNKGFAPIGGNTHHYVNGEYLLTTTSDYPKEKFEEYCRKLDEAIEIVKKESQPY